MKFKKNKNLLPLFKYSAGFWSFSWIKAKFFMTEMMSCQICSEEVALVTPDAKAHNNPCIAADDTLILTKKGMLEN